MKSVILFTLSAVATLVSADWYNNIPVPGKRPAFVTGTAK